jgi:hypothetical protein
MLIRYPCKSNRRSTVIVRKVCIPGLLALLTCSRGFAQPTVSTVSSSNLQHGGTVTIGGANFGTKIPAAPLVWENFEDDSYDPDLTRAGLVTDSEVSNQRSGSLRSGKGNFQVSEYICGQTTVTATKWFAQCWYKLPADFTWGRTGSQFPPLANIKFFRPWATGGGPNYMMSWDTWQGADTANEVVEYTGETDHRGYMHPKADISLGDWHCHEFEYCENTAVGVADGKSHFWFDCALKLNRNTLLTASTAYPTREKRILLIGVCNVWEHTPEPCYAWLDDFYLDTTWARIMIGNAAAWEQCTHREVQIPSAWSDTSITVTVNQGSFKDGAQAYLYVVDADGSVNTQGFPISFGQAEQPIADLTPPFVTGQSPAPGEKNVPVNSSIVLHVQDYGDGVDVDSMQMRVNGQPVTPQVTGSLSDYTVSYDPAQDFSHNQTVTIVVAASDLAGNDMTSETYTFTTEEEGLPPSEDPAATDANVFFYDDFEGGDFSRWDGTSNIQTSTGKAQIVAGAIPGSTGTKIAQFTTYDAGGDNAFADLRKNFPPGYDTVYGRWYVKFASDFDQGNGMHFCGFIGGAAKWRSDFKPDGTDAFSSWLDPGRDWGNNPPPGTLHLYTYYPDMTQDPDGHWWGNEFRPPTPFQLERDRWYCMEMMIKTNTPGQMNGEQAFWVDGEKIGHWTGMRWRDVNSLKSDFFWLEVFIHESSKNNIVWFDNVALSTSYIGPMSRGPDSTPPTTSGHSPAKGATYVPIDSDISLHVTDAGDGVERSSISMTVNGETVTPVITGTDADYLVVYDPPTNFAYGHTVAVTIDAQDLHSPPNVMPRDSYTFVVLPATPGKPGPAAPDAAPNRRYDFPDGD